MSHGRVEWWGQHSMTDRPDLAVFVPDAGGVR